MNDDDYRKMYDTAYEVAKRAAGHETQAAMLRILMLIDELRADIVALQRSTAKNG